jgi:hypothetical protein
MEKTIFQGKKVYSILVMGFFEKKHLSPRKRFFSRVRGFPRKKPYK